jgi:chemotaxis-related protein WspD
MHDTPEGDIVRPVAEIAACWKQIGVFGDVSCARLKQYVHCHNCPAFSAGAVRLLDRDPPVGYLAEWTDRYSREPHFEAAGTHSVVLFRLGIEHFALPTQVLDEIAEFAPVHSLPHRRHRAVMGVINVRGVLLICVSLKKVLGLDEDRPDGRDEGKFERGPERRRLMIFRHDGLRTAFLVDEVHGTHRYHLGELKPVPTTVAKAPSAYTKATLPWRNNVVGCLDEQCLIQTVNRAVS